MQARIKKSELDAFKLQASFINPNKLLPILAYIKIDIEGDYCSITKSNNESFVVRTISNDSEDCSFLVDERILYSFVDFSNSEYINFRDEGNRIKIYDDRTDTLSPTDRAANFPPIEKNVDDWTPLPKLALVSAGIVGQIVFNGEIMDAKSFVFFGDGCIAGSDGSIGYLQDIQEPIPELVLRREVAACISKMTSCLYNRNKNYDFFKEDMSLYGFIRSEYPFMLLRPAFARLESDLSFCTQKSSFVKFNNHCTTASLTKSIAVTFECGAGILFLQMVDSKMEIESKTQFPVKGESGKFKYDPATLSNLLKVVPCDEVFFYPGPNRYYITDADKSFLSVIMLIQ